MTPATAPPAAAAARRRYLSLLSGCADRPASFVLADGSTVTAARLTALHACGGDEDSEDALAVVEGLETPLGTATVAALRIGDVFSFTVPWGER